MAVAAIVMPPAPIGIISASDNGNDVENASATEAMPRTIAPSGDADRARPPADDQRDRGAERAETRRGHEESVARGIAAEDVRRERRDDDREVHADRRDEADDRDPQQHERGVADEAQPLAQVLEDLADGSRSRQQPGHLQLAVAHHPQADDDGDEAQRR